ncbi:acetyl-CoA carboxylase, biotin carboxyl carrier protein [Enterococcus sp. AZ194]|uniref:acetyl-CoA carboxylase biotin carboxyl carrier protein n=1 Tax=Enterococcus sp. AZ194 TaxID=2774629 RepID=UPI003F27096B
MNISEIKELLNQFDVSSLTEFDLREGDFELYMNKNSESRQQVMSTPVQSIQASAADLAATPVSVPIQALQSTETSNSANETPGKQAEGEEILSPIVGVVYLQPSPDKPAYKSVGDTVKKGEVLCIIEAMKLMNEITSEFDGEITEILVNNEDVVEFHQPLFRIKSR